MLPLTTSQIRAALLLCVLAAAGWTVRLYLATGEQNNLAPFDPYPATRTTLARADSIRSWLDSPVAINSADTGALQRLHGIGPELARRIVDERNSGGAFGNLDELARRVPGIGPATTDGMTGKITFEVPEKTGSGSGR